MISKTIGFRGTVHYFQTHPYIFGIYGLYKRIPVPWPFRIAGFAKGPTLFEDFAGQSWRPWFWRHLLQKNINMLDYQGSFTNLDSLCSKDCVHGLSTLVHWKLGWTWFCKACTTSLVCTFLLQCFPLFGKWERLAVHDVTLFNFHLMAASWRHIELCEDSSYLFLFVKPGILIHFVPTVSAFTSES